MKVKCKVCGEWFEKENLYCDHCAAKYGSERSRYDIDLFEDQRSFSKEDKEKIDRKKSTSHQASSKPLKELRPKQEDNETGKKKSFKNTFRAIVFFFVLLNILMNIMADMDIDDFIGELINGDNGAVVYEEAAVPIDEYSEQESFPINTILDYSGDTSAINHYPQGIYQGDLWTSSYLNFDTKEMRFDISDKDYSGIYKLPIFITVTPGTTDDEYYMDVWDQNTLKTLGTYIVEASYFTGESQGDFEGNPSHLFYDEADYTELEASYDDISIDGRLALPYTIDNEINYFNFSVEKVNDDASLLISQSYLENEYFESFISEDGQLSINFYTYGTPQGYPHSSMYYDGVFVLSDGDNAYPPLPFYVSVDGDIYADMSVLDTAALTIRDKDFSDTVYYDDVDTQLYRYFPIFEGESLYDLELSAQVYEDGEISKIDGQYRVYNHSDGQDEYFKSFTLNFVE